LFLPGRIDVDRHVLPLKLRSLGGCRLNLRVVGSRELCSSNSNDSRAPHHKRARLSGQQSSKLRKESSKLAPRHSKAKSAPKLPVQRFFCKDRKNHSPLICVFALSIIQLSRFDPFQISRP